MTCKKLDKFARKTSSKQGEKNSGVSEFHSFFVRWRRTYVLNKIEGKAKKRLVIVER